MRRKAPSLKFNNVASRFGITDLVGHLPVLVDMSFVYMEHAVSFTPRVLILNGYMKHMCALFVHCAVVRIHFPFSISQRLLRSKCGIIGNNGNIHYFDVFESRIVLFRYDVRCFGIHLLIFLLSVECPSRPGTVSG